MTFYVHPSMPVEFIQTHARPFTYVCVFSYTIIYRLPLLINGIKMIIIFKAVRLQAYSVLTNVTCNEGSSTFSIFHYMIHF
jgi:hypothetical protein